MSLSLIHGWLLYGDARVYIATDMQGRREETAMMVFVRLLKLSGTGKEQCLHCACASSKLTARKVCQIGDRNVCAGHRQGGRRGMSVFVCGCSEGERSDAMTQVRMHPQKCVALQTLPCLLLQARQQLLFPPPMRLSSRLTHA